MAGSFENPRWKTLTLDYSWTVEVLSQNALFPSSSIFDFQLIKIHNHKILIKSNDCFQNLGKGGYLCSQLISTQCSGLFENVVFFREIYFYRTLSFLAKMSQVPSVDKLKCFLNSINRSKFLNHFEYVSRKFLSFPASHI